jgi:anti-sigma factor RsiW
MEKNLIAYLDGKASPSERHKVEEHLAVCGECCERAEQFRALFGVLDEWQAPPPSATFDANVLSHVAQAPLRGGFWAWLIPSPRAAFALTVVVLLSVWLSSMRPIRPSQVVVAQSSGGEADFKMIEDLPVLEDYDVLSNFDALSYLPASPASAPATQAQPRL